MASPVLESAALGGDPAAIRGSARVWARTSRQCAVWADDVRCCRASGFDGDEAALFDARIDEYGRALDAAATAWRSGGGALARYAEVLESCQERLLHLVACATEPVTDDGEPWHAPDLPAPHAPLLHSRVAPVLAEHDDAVRRCRRELDAARLLLPTTAQPERWLTSPTPLRGASGTVAPRSISGAWWQHPGGTRAATDLGTVAASLRIPAGQSAMLGMTLPPRPTDPDDFFSEIGEMLATAATALALLDGGGGGGLAIAGGAVAVAGAPEVAAVAGAATGAAAAGVGLAVLIASIVEGESPGEEFDDVLHGNKIEGTPEVNPHDLAQLNRQDIPPDVLKEVDRTIARAKIGMKRFPGHDGKPWENSDGHLPTKGPNYYTEWTAAANGSKRGPYRVIIGGDATNPEAIYFWDHKGRPVYIGP